MVNVRCILGGLGLGLVLGLSGCATAPSAGVTRDWGPFYCADRTLNGEARVRALGPFFERRAGEDRRFDAVRPFYAADYCESDDYVSRHFLWPLGVSKDFGRESYWRFLLAFGHDFDTTRDDDRYRFMLFPLIFAGKDKDRNPYFAVFPLGGTIREFLGQDQISFALFPLYMRSRVNDVKSLDVLWPVYSRSEGGDVDRFRVFPFYGYSINGTASDKRFVLWPFWTQAEFNHPKSHGGGHVLFPLYGHMKLSDQETWMALPPFFRWTQGESGDVIHAPWPLVQYRTTDGAADDKFYLWPLWGRKQIGTVRSWFCLYPIFGGSTMDRVEYEQTRWNIVPFFYSERRTPKHGKGGESGVVTNPPPEVALYDEDAIASPLPRGASDRRYLKIWPLFSYWREEDASRTRFPDLWPFRQTVGVEHSWAPIWTLYKQERRNDAEDDELLWGLYRHRRQGGERRVSIFPLFERSRRDDGTAGEWSLLKGLAGYRRSGLNSELRLLYVIRLKRGGEQP